MPRPKLPRPVGIRIEIAKAGGLTDNELISLIQRGDYSALRQAGPDQLSWDILKEYAEENGTALEQAIREGYTFSFLTVRGLIHYLLYRFGLKQQQDFQVTEGALDGVALTGAEVADLRSTVPAFWHLTEIGTAHGSKPDSSPPGGNESKVFRIERLNYHSIPLGGGETG
ncbi:hypothetical protein LJK88_27690 [Paenibacillus sp. P26]|nr:hypothetical protein LJK88_27690 [Paenibacillus sp. P26]